MEKFKIKTNCILGNIYARNAYEDDLRMKAKKKAHKTEKEYYELVTKTVQGGEVQKLVKVPYPITADYVKSHASNVDYKTNLDSCLNLPARGVPLGDLTEVQNLLCRDTEQARAIMKKLQENIKKIEEAKQAKGVTENEKPLSSKCE